MSRVGRTPVSIPAGVKAEIVDGEVRVVGPKGKLVTKIPAGVNVSQAGDQVSVAVDRSIRMKERDLSSRHGLVRSLIQNMVDGVTKGFEKKLEVMGAGFRPQV